MSQDQKTTPIPIPTIYEDEQEMLNGNGEPMPHPQPGIPLLEGVPQGDQAKVVVQEPSEAVVMREAAFEGPRIFVHAPRYEWRPEVRVQGQDEEARWRIVSMEELLHRFGCRTEAREEELCQRLDEVQASYASLAKEVHDLQQYTITEIASCISRIDPLKGEMQQQLALIQQVSTNVTALEKGVALLEKAEDGTPLGDLQVKLNQTNEDLIRVKGHWDNAKGKLEEQEKELEAVRAQLEQRLQGLEECTKNEKTLLESQSGRIDVMQGTLQDLQKGQSALANVISNIQENVTCSKDHAESSEDEEEKPPVPKSVLSPAGPSGESMERPDTAYKSPTLGEREGAKLPQMTFEMEHGTPFPLPRNQSGLDHLWKQSH